tara:strand:+ start:725 stop:916 length:192 start_codon:yes stop_codon:yes gene_type:complete
MKYKNVINAVTGGKSVYWSNTNYKIIYDKVCDRYLIHSQSNNHYVEFGNDEYYLKKCFIKESK